MPAKRSKSYTPKRTYASKKYTAAPRRKSAPKYSKSLRMPLKRAYTHLRSRASYTLMAHRHHRHRKYHHRSSAATTGTATRYSRQKFTFLVPV